MILPLVKDQANISWPLSLWRSSDLLVMAQLVFNRDPGLVERSRERIPRYTANDRRHKQTECAGDVAAKG